MSHLLAERRCLRRINKCEPWRGYGTMKRDTAHGFSCRGGSISSLAYHPSRNMAATTGSSGDLKIWMQQGSSSRGRAAHWRCHSVGSHTGNTHASLLCHTSGCCSVQRIAGSHQPDP